MAIPNDKWDEWYEFLDSHTKDVIDLMEEAVATGDLTGKKWAVQSGIREILRLTRANKALREKLDQASFHDLRDSGGI